MAKEANQPGPDAAKYRIDQYLDSIRNWAIKNGFNRYALATTLGMSPSALRDMFQETWNPKVETLRLMENFILEHTEEQRRLLAKSHPLDPTHPTE